MKKLFAVALGGALGSLIRYLIAESIPNYPIAIFFANLIGVAVAGLISFRLLTSELSKLFWIPGFAGGLTTFSSVAVIYIQNNTMEAIAYFYGTLIASIVLLYVIKTKVTP